MFIIVILIHTGHASSLISISLLVIDFIFPVLVVIRLMIYALVEASVKGLSLGAAFTVGNTASE